MIKVTLVTLIRSHTNKKLRSHANTKLSSLLSVSNFNNFNLIWILCFQYSNRIKFFLIKLLQMELTFQWPSLK